MDFPHATLEHNLIAFCNLLRSSRKVRFVLGPQEALDGLRALESVDLGSLQQVRQALKLVLCSSLEQERAFDDLFFQFFLPARRRKNVTNQNKTAVEGGEPEGERLEKHKPTNTQAAAPAQDSQGKGKTAEEDDPNPFGAILKALFSRTAGAEAGDVEISIQDLDEMMRAATHLVNQVRLGRSRRWEPTSKGRRFHFRRTVRKALHTGGDPIYPAWLEHPKRQPRFVFVLDGSRSMGSYSDKLLQFAFALRTRCSRVEVFSFSTELRRITRELEKAKSLSQRPKLSRLGQAWGGGTKIGENLLALERRHGGLIRGDTILIIASDGLDTGEPELLEFSLRQLYQKSAALVWLNPLLAKPGYDPRMNCMSVALPFLDRHTSADSPEQFAGLAEGLRLRT